MMDVQLYLDFVVVNNKLFTTLQLLIIHFSFDYSLSYLLSMLLLSIVINTFIFTYLSMHQRKCTKNDKIIFGLYFHSFHFCKQDMNHVLFFIMLSEIIMLQNHVFLLKHVDFLDVLTFNYPLFIF